MTPMGSFDFWAMKDYQRKLRSIEKLGKKRLSKFYFGGALRYCTAIFSLYDEATEIRKSTSGILSQSPIQDLYGNLRSSQYNQAERLRKNGRLDSKKETLLAIDQPIPLGGAILYFEAIATTKVSHHFCSEGNELMGFLSSKGEKLIRF